ADQAGGKNTLRVVAERFLSWCQVNKKPKTLKMYTECLLPLCNFRQRPGDPLFGELTLNELREHHIHGWTEAKRRGYTDKQGRVRKWTDGHVRNAINAMQACLNYGVKKGLIPRNPVKAMARPDSRSRGESSLLGRTEEERAANHQRVVAA